MHISVIDCHPLVNIHTVYAKMNDNEIWKFTSQEIECLADISVEAKHHYDHYILGMSEQA